MKLIKEINYGSKSIEKVAKGFNQAMTAEDYTSVYILNSNLQKQNTTMHRFVGSILELHNVPCTQNELEDVLCLKRLMSKYNFESGDSKLILQRFKSYMGNIDDSIIYKHIDDRLKYATELKQLDVRTVLDYKRTTTNQHKVNKEVSDIEQQEEQIKDSTKQNIEEYVAKSDLTNKETIIEEDFLANNVSILKDTELKRVEDSKPISDLANMIDRALANKDYFSLGRLIKDLITEEKDLSDFKLGFESDYFNLDTISKLIADKDIMIDKEQLELVDSSLSETDIVQLKTNLVKLTESISDEYTLKVIKDIMTNKTLELMGLI